MVQIELDQEIEQRVRLAAEAEHVSESFLIREVLMRWLEDREDYAAGIHALSTMKYTISQEEMERRSDVAG
jgi:predicted DNA-binding protein